MTNYSLAVLALNLSLLFVGQAPATSATPLSIVRRQAGTQFITGDCNSDNDCASTCCGFNSGKCAAIFPAQERDGGCGFGDPEPNNPLLAAAPRSVVRRQAGTQFITGDCNSDAECASTCCGFNSGKCAAIFPAQERDGGCGFGDPEPNNPLLAASRRAISNPRPISIARRQAGTQFITGECASDAECASTCCGFNSGKCAAIIPAQERDGGCGFGDAEPNNPLLAGGAADADAEAEEEVVEEPVEEEAPEIAPGTQFITGDCSSDTDCASGCCGFNSGKCAAVIPAQERDGGCGFGDAEPNNPLLN